MAVSPQMVFFGIKALIKLGHAGRRAYEDKVVGQPLDLPGIFQVDVPKAEDAAAIVDDALSNDRPVPSPKSREELLEAIRHVTGAGATADQLFESQLLLVEVAAEIDPNIAVTEDSVDIFILEQWSSEIDRTTPLGRVGLALADVALEYVGLNPGLFGVGGTGEKLIGSVALNLRELLPDPDNNGARGNNFAEGAIRVFVQAGLQTLNTHVEDIIEEEHLQDLTTSILGPLIDRVKKGEAGVEKWYDIRDTLLGPIAEAAIGAVARHQTEFLGKKFNADEAVGAVTQSVLLAVKDNGLTDDFGKDGVIRIYRSALDVAIAQPGLFLGEITENGNTLLVGQAVLRDVAAMLKEATPPFSKKLAAEAVATALDSVGANSALLFDLEGDWANLSGEALRTLVREVAGGLADGVRGSRNPDIFARLFNEDQAKRFLNLFLREVAASPGLIVNDKASPEVRALITIIAKAMAEQDSLLLSADDWLRVAGAVSSEVARNPARLIKLDGTAPETQLAYKIMASLLKAAGEGFNRAAGATVRGDGAVLFGETLADTIETSMLTAAGNAEKALANVGALESFAGRLNALAISHTGRIGRREYLLLFRRFVAGILDTGQIPQLSDDQLIDMLYEKQPVAALGGVT